MKKNCLALALSAALLSSFAIAAGPVATVNGVAIPQSKVDLYLEQLAARGQQDSPDLRAKIREELIRSEIIAQEASKTGVDKTPAFLSQVELARSQILVSTYINDYIKKHAPSEADMKKEYDAAKSQFTGKEYHARHILVKTEAEANTIIASLKKGKKFDDLAKTKSQDPGSKDNGGDLGWAKPENFVPEFGEAMAKLGKGKVTDAPVKTQFGFHIIKMEDVRDIKGPTYEQLKPQIEQKLQGDIVQKLLADLRAKAKVE